MNTGIGQFGNYLFIINEEGCLKIICNPLQKDLG